MNTSLSEQVSVLVCVEKPFHPEIEWWRSFSDTLKENKRLVATARPLCENMWLFEGDEAETRAMEFYDFCLSYTSLKCCAYKTTGKMELYRCRLSPAPLQPQQQAGRNEQPAI